MLLVVLVTSLVPYAVTWRLIGDWRFTAHAYPFLLLAAACVLLTLVRVVIPSWRTAFRQRTWPATRTVVRGTTLAAALIVGTWIVLVPLPMAVAAEAFRLDGAVTASPGPRDRAFFERGWMAPVTAGNVTARISEGTTASIRMPTAPGRPYEVTLRMDPFPAPGPGSTLPAVRVFADGQPAGRVQLTWTPDRFGAYTLPLPPATSSTTELQLFVDQPAQGPSQVRFWWIRVHLR